MGEVCDVIEIKYIFLLIQGEIVLNSIDKSGKCYEVPVMIIETKYIPSCCLNHSSVEVAA